MNDCLWDFMGSVIEGVSLCFLLRLLTPAYKKGKAKQLAAILIMAAVVLLTGYVHWIIGFVLNYGVFILCLSAAVKRNPLFVIIEYFIAMTVYGIIQFMTIELIQYLGLPPVVSPSPGMLGLLLPLLCCSVLAGSNGKLCIKCNSVYAAYRREMFVVTVNLFFIYQTELYLWDIKKELWNQTANIILAVFLFWILLNGILLKNLIENQKQKELLRIHDLHMSMTNRFFDELLAEKHEFNRHLQYISGCIATKEPEIAVTQIEEYIEDLTGQREHNSTTGLILTCSDDLNALLYDEQRRWEKRGVTILCNTADIPSDFPLHRYEFVELTGNLIRNGCEHAALLAVGKRNVLLEISRTEKGSCVSVTNEIGAVKQSLRPDEFKRKRFSTKEGTGRGYGLYNVQRIAEKHGGKLEAVSDGDHLCMRVLFP